MEKHNSIRQVLSTLIDSKVMINAVEGGVYIIVPDFRFGYPEGKDIYKITHVGDSVFLMEIVHTEFDATEIPTARFDYYAIDKVIAVKYSMVLST